MKNLLVTLLLISSAIFSSPAAHAESSFLALAELTGGIGTSGSQTSIPSRNMAFSEFGLRLGYAFRWFAPVIEGTYRYLGQTTDSATVGGTNMAGNGYLLGAGVNLYFSKFSLTGMYDFSGAFSLAKPTASGLNESYTNPAGFRVTLGIHLSASWDLVATYSNINYNNSKTDSGTTSLSGDLVNQTVYGLGLQAEL